MQITYFLRKFLKAYIGKLDEARKSLKWLRGSSYNPEKEIQDIIEFQNTQETKGFKAFFEEQINRKILFIGVIMFMGYEFSGMNAVLFYTTSIFTVNHKITLYK